MAKKVCLSCTQAKGELVSYGLSSQEQSSKRHAAAEGNNIEEQQGRQLKLSMLCKELAYPIRTFTHAFTPPDMPARRGELTTVVGRVLQALHLRHCGKAQEYFLHKKYFPFVAYRAQ